MKKSQAKTNMKEKNKRSEEYKVKRKEYDIFTHLLIFSYNTHQISKCNLEYRSTASAIKNILVKT